MIETQATKPVELEIKPDKTVKSEDKSNEIEVKFEKESKIVSKVQIVGEGIESTKVIESKPGTIEFRIKLRIKWRDFYFIVFF